MTKQQIKNKERFAKAILKTAQANGKKMTYPQALGAAEYIHRVEATLSRLAEMECDGYWYNVYWKNGVYPKQERAEARILKYIRENIGCNCFTQRDPRGFCVRLHLKNEATGYFCNTWDGETSGANW